MENKCSNTEEKTRFVFVELLVSLRLIGTMILGNRAVGCLRIYRIKWKHVCHLQSTM